MFLDSRLEDKFVDCIVEIITQIQCPRNFAHEASFFVVVVTVVPRYLNCETFSNETSTCT
jgi:hypothetical protein